MAKNTVFIHTNREQMIGAKLSKFSLEKNRKSTASFDVEIITLDDNKDLMHFNGKKYTYKNTEVVFSVDDVQSFTLLRFTPPEIMQYNGKSIVIDPDVFWVSDRDPNELFGLVSDKEYQIACHFDKHYRSSVMILENSSLKHWSMRQTLEKLMTGTPYKDIVELKGERVSIKKLSQKYNSFDAIYDETLFVHFTRRQTQPWKFGLPFREKLENQSIYRKIYRTLRGRNTGTHIIHPNKEAKKFFDELFIEAFDSGIFTKTEIMNEIEMGYLSEKFIASLNIL